MVSSPLLFSPMGLLVLKKWTGFNWWKRLCIQRVGVDKPSGASHRGMDSLALERNPHDDDRHCVQHRLAGCRIEFQVFDTRATGGINLRLEAFKDNVHPGKCVGLPLDLERLKLDKRGVRILHLLDDLSMANRVIEDIVDHADIIVGEPDETPWREKKGGGGQGSPMQCDGSDIAIIVAHLSLGECHARA